MRICYALFSPTFGMHQYTADLANRMALAGHEIHLVTTARLPRDRYLPSVTIHALLDIGDTGLSRSSLRIGYPGVLRKAILAVEPDVVHFTGPHIYDPLLVRGLTRLGTPVVHTIHDLDPHSGKHYGALLRIWNRLIIRTADHILVHGQCYRERLLATGLAPERVTHTPLLHLFMSAAQEMQLSKDVTPVEYRPWALFFGRLERYKGVQCLLTACDMMDSIDREGPAVVVAGPGNASSLWSGPLPQQLELRNRLIGDAEAIDLFRCCGLVVLPYLDATQSALIAAAYYFRKPVLVTATGALPEYVTDGQTGLVVEPSHPATLARHLDDMLCDATRLARMGEAGRRWYDEQRAVEMQTLLGMYKKVVHTRPIAQPSVLPAPVSRSR